MIRQALLTQYQMNARAAGMNLDGISHEESLVVPALGGNPINWVLGHLLDSRNAVLALLGESPVWGGEQNALYGTKSDPLAAGWEALPFEELRSRHDACQARLVRALEAVDIAALEKPVPKVFEPQQHEPAGVQLAFLAFHEAYHVGQLGLLRRMLGKPTAIGAPRR